MKKFYISVILVASCLAMHAEEWRALGMATVCDGWITPGYVDDAGVQIDPSTCPFEVPVQVSVDRPGVYKLINPFGSSDFHLSEFNIAPAEADIIIDARDRTFVIIESQPSGFTDADDSQATGSYTYYITDMGSYMYSMGQQREVINLLRCASTMSGNIINVPQPAFASTQGGRIEAWDPSYPASIILPDDSSVDPSQWEVMGTATVTDGWIVPGFKDDNDNTLVPEEHTFTCKVAFNTDNPNLIALVSPYKSSTFALAYTNLASGIAYIVLDTTDPELVTIAPQFSGYIARQDNDIRQYFISDAGTLLLERGTSKADIIARGYNATYDAEHSVITVPQPLFGFDITGASKMWNNPHSTIIDFGHNGIRDIDTDDAAVAPVYYNLQGMEVAQPQRGSLYIVRRGAHSTKVIY